MKVRWGRVIFGLFVLAVGCGLVGMLLANNLARQGGPIADTSPTDEPRSGYPGGSSGGQSATARPAATRPRVDVAGRGDLPPFKVLTVQYTPYMATLIHMAAGGYMADEGYDLQLVDGYAAGLDDPAQCDALKAGDYDALATTLSTLRLCGEGTTIAIPLGQSAGADAIVVKQGVESWNDVFEHAIAFAGNGVSEFMACFASHTANTPLKLPLRYDSAAKAVDAWINSGVEQDIASVAAWEPEVTRALNAVPNSRILLSSKDVRIIWDVLAFSKVKTDADRAPFDAFTRAYYRSLLDLGNSSSAAFTRMMEWAAGNEERTALLATTDDEAFDADMDREAFATLRDAATLMSEGTTLRNRLDEAAFYWRYCQHAVPQLPSDDVMIDSSFVLKAREDATLVGNPNDRPSAEVFQVTDFTNREAVTDDQIAGARKIFETGVEIEFLPNRTDFRDPAAALSTLEDAVRFLRTCADCVLEVQGSSALPGAALARNQASQADADALAVARGRKVADTLQQQFDVPPAQLKFIETAHERRFAGSVDEAELRQDRRTYLTGYQLTGGL